MINRGTSKKGFTLIEILIVVAVIGILAAIAIPEMSAYRQRGFNTSALADLKNFRICIEVSHENENLYPVSVVGGETITAGDSAGTPGLHFSTSSNVFLWYESNTNAYLANSWHKTGTKQFGTDQKSSDFHVAPGIVPIHVSLTDHVANNQIWPAPWEAL